jgi:hypothetical protein
MEQVVRMMRSGELRPGLFRMAPGRKDGDRNLSFKDRKSEIIVVCDQID